MKNKTTAQLLKEAEANLKAAQDEPDWEFKEAWVEDRQIEVVDLRRRLTIEQEVFKSKGKQSA